MSFFSGYIMTQNSSLIQGSFSAPLYFDLAEQLREKFRTRNYYAAVFLQQLHYWINKGCGKLQSVRVAEDGRPGRTRAPLEAGVLTCKFGRRRAPRGAPHRSGNDPTTRQLSRALRPWASNAASTRLAPPGGESRRWKFRSRLISSHCMAGTCPTRVNTTFASGVLLIQSGRGGVNGARYPTNERSVGYPAAADAKRQ